MNRILALAYVAMIASNWQAAQAQSPAGAWHGAVTRDGIGEVRLEARIEETNPGVFSGVLGSPDQGSITMPLADIVTGGGALSFNAPAMRVAFAGAWDATAKAWVGEYRHPAGNSPIRFEPGPAPPLPPLPAVAGLDGRWEGKVQGAFPVTLRIQSDASATRALMDMTSPTSTGIPIRAMTRENTRVTFAIPALRMTFEAQLSPEGDKLTGTVAQAGQALPFQLARVSADAATVTAAAVRPQTPKPPFPYKVEDVIFDNPAAPGVRLACSLTSPNSAGPHPAALLISGSGPHDRDAEVLGHKTFLVLADHLTRKGVAVLRCDDRGVAKSTGDFQTATIEDFASDAEAGFAFLRMRADIDPKRIGLIGHSLGTVIAPKAAAKHDDVAFLVLLAAAGAPGRDISIDQQQTIARAGGMPETYLASSGALWRKVVAIVNSPADNATVRSSLLALFLAEGPSAYPDGMSEAAAKSEADRLSTDYTRGLQAYDPAKVFRNLKMPILAVNGALDVQATPALNLGGLRKILAKHPDATIVEMPGLNHAFQHARTGAMSEYADIEETFAPEALELISSWMLKRFGR